MKLVPIVHRLIVDPRVRLVRVEPRDAARVFAQVEANREHLRRWLPWVDGTTSEAGVLAFIQASQVRSVEGTGFDFVIERDQHEMCGLISWNRVDRQNRAGEIGYWLRADLLQRGIMTACCRRLLAHGFVDLELNRITIATAIDNERSRALAERLGFRFEGVAREAEWLNDRFVHLARYAMLRHEWDDPARPRAN
jgi:ribosomal-protein-serine acetyltransferase